MHTIVFIGGEDVSARIDISKKLAGKGCDVTIMGTEDEAIFKANQVPYHKIGLNRELNLFDDIRTLFSIRKFLKSKKGNIIAHAFDTKFTLLLPAAAFGLRHVKVVRTINGMGRIFTEENTRNSVLKQVYKVMQKSVRKRSDFTIFQNTDNYRYFLENRLCRPEASGVIKGSGVNIDDFGAHPSIPEKQRLVAEIGIDAGQPTFILVSRLIVQKGVLHYLEAARQLRAAGYRYNFLLVGQTDSNADGVTPEMIDGYSGVVTYLGRRNDVGKLLSVSDIFVLPSYYSEGVPRVLLEASAAGLALISTDMPGCNDVVVDGFNGKIVKIKDTEDLRLKMLEIAEDREKMHLYQKNAQQHIQQFSLDNVVQQHYELYGRLMGTTK